MVRLNILLDPMKPGSGLSLLSESLHRMIVGQDQAIDQIVNTYQMHLAGLSAPNRPIGNFLFLGPTGSGKTRIVEATAETLLKNSRALIKVDCGEFQHSHEIAKLIGSPPGYLGHRETHPMLSQEVLNQHHTEETKLSFLLFDEIEKASDALWNLLLGILDKATLTLGDNRRVDFSRAMVFMTSNLGAAEMSDIMTPAAGLFGFPGVATSEFRRHRRSDDRKNPAHRRGSGAEKVYAGVHEPAGRNRHLPSARSRAAQEDSRHRIEPGTTAYSRASGVIAPSCSRCPIRPRTFCWKKARISGMAPGISSAPSRACWCSRCPISLPLSKCTAAT